jgi:MFS family permease
MPASRSFVSDLRVVLQGRDFRKLFAVRLVSQASDGAFQVGLASLVFFSPERDATTTAAAMAAVVTVLPYTLVGPFAGVLLDVWQRRQVLLVANAVRALMVVGVAALVLWQGVGLPLYVAALACMSVNRFFLAGLGASLPAVVPKHELVMANAVSPTCGTVAALVGAGAGYGVRRVLGPGDPTDAVVVLVAALGYAASALLARRMARTLLGPAEPAPLSRGSVVAAGADLWHDIFAGARHVRERRPAFYALSVIGVHRIAYGITTIATVLLCRNYFSDPADVDAGLAKLALVFGASAAGIATAALLTPIAAGRFGPQRWIAIAIACAVVFQLAFVAQPTETLMYVSAYTLNFVAQSVKICVDAIVQETVDDAFRGRVFSFYDVVFNVAFVSSAGVAVLVVPADGFSPPLFAGLAALYAATAAGYALALRNERRRNATGAPMDSTRPQLVQQ